MRVTFILMLLFIPLAAGFGQDTTGVVVPLTEEIGLKLDSEERDSDRMFMGFQPFESAVLIQRADGTFVFRIEGRRLNEQYNRVHWIEQSGEEVDSLRSALARRDRTAPAQAPVSVSAERGPGFFMVVGQLIGGGLFGLAGGAAGGTIGKGIRGRPDWECPDCPDNVGWGEGFALGCAVGSAFGVRVIGHLRGDEGSLTSALGGAFVPVAVAILCGEIKRDPHAGLIAVFGGSLSPLFAVMAYHSSGRGGKDPAAFFNAADGRTTIAFPHVSVWTGCRREWNMSVNLADISF